jgi:filamentous hemagglutinin
MWLFDADPDFQWFPVPNSPAGTNGSTLGNVGYLLGGAAGIVRRGAGELIAASPSSIASTYQGTRHYPGIDRFRDIMLKKGTVVLGGYPGQSAFYTTMSALRRSGQSAAKLFGGLQVRFHESHGYRARVAAYEVIEDTPAAIGLALANSRHGLGRYPQIVVPSFATTLRRIDDFPLDP